VLAIKAKEMGGLKGLMTDLQITLVPFEKELARRATNFFGGINNSRYRIIWWLFASHHLSRSITVSLNP
jgi:predicted HAD superfamily phosphohydrolase YqeG